MTVDPKIQSREAAMKKPTLIVAWLIAFLTLAGMSGCPERSGGGYESGGGSSSDESGGY